MNVSEQISNYETNLNKIKSITEDTIKNGKFFDIENYLSYAKTIIIISYKGTGKSTSCINHIVKNLNTNINAAWIRNTDIELRNSDIQASFQNCILMNGFKENQYVARKTGIYKLDPNNFRVQTGKKQVIFTDVNKSFNVASQNALECDFIVYDEFINPEFNKKSLFSDFLKMCSTLGRKHLKHIILLGNAHINDNDILAGLGIEFNWESGKTQYIYRPDQELLAIFLERYEVKGMKSTDNYIDKLSKYSEELARFQAGKVQINNMTNVKNWIINKIAENFKPLWLYDADKTTFCVGQYNQFMYVKQLYANDYPNLNHFCYRPMDITPNNTYVYRIEDYTTVEKLISMYRAGRLLFSTSYGKSVFIELLLPYLKNMLVNRDKQKY